MKPDEPTRFEALQYASAALRADWAVLEIAMAQDWRAWEFAAPSLQRHPKATEGSGDRSDRAHWV